MSSEDFPARCLRNHIDELYPTFQPLVPRLLLLDVFLNAALDRDVGFFEADGAGFDDERFGDLAGALVGDLDDGTVLHGRVVEEAGFELGGGDLVAL